MKITFVLPFDGKKPVGGTKVVFEYANQLTQLGHHVRLIHPAGLYLGVGKNDRWHRNLVKYFWFGLTRFYLPQSWFSLNPSIQVDWVPSLAKLFIPQADVIVATAWETAEYVANYPDNRGRKFYLIQHFEDWFGDRERLLGTWRLPLKKVVISKWLGDIAISIGESFCYIPNGLDFEEFGIDCPPEERKPLKLLMLYHHLNWKGTKEGLAAIVKAREQIPNISVTLFGATAPEENELPDWVNFEQLPSRKRLRELYNEAAIFISPSWSEGWALPPAEAMQCGCATILTNIGGHEYAVDKKTSLLSPPKDVDKMAENLLHLLRDNKLRISLANQAVDKISKFTWLRAARSLEAYFEDAP